MPQDHVRIFFDPLGTQRPTPGDRMKTPFDMFYTFYLWEHTKIGIKIFEIDFVIEI